MTLGETRLLTGAERIGIERARQKLEEGYDAGHDHGHADELALAGACYAIPHDRREETTSLTTTVAGIQIRIDIDYTRLWPWAAIIRGSELPAWLPPTASVEEIDAFISATHSLERLRDGG